jgi:AraC-like DNA-binding protein
MGRNEGTSRTSEPPATLTRVDLSIGSLDLLRLVRYDHDFPRHSHDRFTVGVFELGSGRLRYRGARWTATDASVLAVSPDEVHEAEPFAHGGWTYRTMYPTVELMALALGDSARAASVLFPEPIFDDPSLSAGLLRIHKTLVAGRADVETEERLLALLRRLVHRHAMKRPTSTVRAETRAVSLARRYLDESFAQPVRLADLAAHCGSSPFHLVRSFRDAVGMPPHAYLTQVRAMRARELLMRGETPSGAAYLCGFCDQSHLTRTFKRYYGVTPGAYTGASRGARATT